MTYSNSTCFPNFIDFDGYVISEFEFYWIYYIVCRIYFFVLNCEYLIISSKLFFNVQIHFDKNVEDKLFSVPC